MRQPARRALTRFVTASAAVGLIASLTGGPAAAGPDSDERSGGGGGVVPMNYAINAFEIRNGDWDGQRSYKFSTRAVRRAVEAEGGDVITAYPKIGVVIARAVDPTFVDAMRSEEHADVVESIGATRTSPTTIPDDPKPALRPLIEPEPLEDEQWGNQELESLDANEIEDGAGVRVGVLDSGLDMDHPDLAAGIDKAASATCTNNGVLETGAGEYTNSTHGTHVAGTIGARRNGVGVAGIAPGVTLVSINVVNDDGFIFPEYAICGFMYANKADVDVTNNSYYIDPWLFWCPTDEDQGPVLEAVGRAIDWTERKGIVNVAAAGNSNYDLANKTTDSSSPNDSVPIPNRPVDGCSDIPVEWENVVAVSATTEAGPKASFSNYGDGVIDVSAPGADILSTIVGGDYGALSGTSMASPHTAGVVALLVSVLPDASPEEIRQALSSTAVDRPCPGGSTPCTGTGEYNGFFGHGVVNALNAVS